MPNRVDGVGNLNPQLVICGEAPGRTENQYQKPFIGKTGEVLDELLIKAGISREACYITNVVKYQPPLNDFKKLNLIGVDLEQSIKELWEFELNQLKPNCILAVGNEALKALTGKSGILQYRGSILLAKDGVTKVVPTVHPAALFPKASESYDDEDSSEYSGALPWTYIKLIQHDITRAVEESATRSLVLPERHLVVAKNSLDVQRFFDEYAHLDKAASDIESINCVPVCVGFAFNKHHALSIPMLRHIGNNKLTDMGIRDLSECWRIIDTQLRRLRLIGHNFKYDEFKLSLVGLACPNVYSDTLIKTRVIFPELPGKYLYVVSSLWTREPFYKDEGKEFRLGKSHADQLMLYNARDCAVEFEVDEEQEKDLISMQEYFKVPLVDYYYKYQMRKHKAYLRMENIGFPVDFARKKELHERYTLMQSEVHARLIERIGHDVNVKSTPQMFDLLYKEMKFKVMKKAPTSEDTIVALMANHAKKAGYKEILSDVLEERRIRDQKSRYISFSPDYDDRCKSSYNVIATETTRSSTGVLKKPLRPRISGLAFHTIAAHGRLAKDIKSMLICEPGKVLIKADASQAEPRIVAVLSRDWELLEAFDKKVDIHRRTAGLILGFTRGLELSSDYSHPIMDKLEKDGPERFSGKKVRNAGNYRMGKRRLMLEVNTDSQKFGIDLNISEWKAGQMLEAFKAASPKLESVFYAEIKEAIDSTRTLIDPFGGPRVFNGKFSEETYKEGLANIPQRTVSHVVQGGMLKFNDEVGWDSDVAYLIGEKHDELVISAPANDWKPYAVALKKAMTTPIDFSIYCTLKRDYVLTIPVELELSDTHLGAFSKISI